MKIGLRSILTVVPLVFAVGADAQVAFPVKPIRIIVPSAPGGGADITTRLVAEKMSAHLRQPIIVENRPGGDGAVGLLSVKHAAADGYTLVSRSDAFVLTPLCPSSDDLRLISGLRKGGSGSSGFKAMRLASGAASVLSGWSGA